MLAVSDMSGNRIGMRARVRIEPVRASDVAAPIPTAIRGA